MCAHHPAVEHPYPQSAVADPGTAPETLARLATLDDVEVLQQIAAHRNTDAATLDRLASPDADRTVRVYAARHPNTAADTLDRLAGDPDGMVRLEVACRKDATAARLDAVARYPDPIAVNREVVASHPNTSANTLSRLAIDSDPGVRSAALANPNTPAAARSAGGLLAG